MELIQLSSGVWTVEFIEGTGRSLFDLMSVSEAAKNSSEELEKELGAGYHFLTI
jgi:hypothetical protein